MTSEKRLEELISEVMKNRLESHNPDLGQVWKKISKELKRRKRRRVAVKFLACAAVAVLCFGAFSLYLEPVKALNKKLWYSFSMIFQENIATILMGNTDGAHTKPPDTKDKPVEETLLEVAKKCPFRLKLPQYLPPVYQLDKIYYTEFGKRGAQVTLQYKSVNSSLVFTQVYAEQQGMGYSYDTDDTIVKDVKINGSSGKLFIREKDNFTQLIWADGEIHYRLGGVIAPEEAKRIAASLEYFFK